MPQPLRSLLTSRFYLACLSAAGLCTCGPTLAAATTNLTLRDTRWVLQTLDGTPAAPAHKGAEVYLVLNAGSQHLSGYAGCNRFRGRYTQRGTQLALKTISSTRMACPLMAQEQRLIEGLGAADGYRIEGQVLSLLQGEVVRVTFSAAGVK